MHMVGKPGKSSSIYTRKNKFYMLNHIISHFNAVTGLFCMHVVAHPFPPHVDCRQQQYNAKFVKTDLPHAGMECINFDDELFFVSTEWLRLLPGLSE